MTAWTDEAIVPKSDLFTYKVGMEVLFQCFEELEEQYVAED